MTLTSESTQHPTFVADHWFDESLPHIICPFVPITLPNVVWLASRGIVSAMDLDNATLHHVIMTDIMERGYTPTPEELVERFERPRPDISRALHALMEYHGLVLHPNSDQIWVVHPFSMAPTGFLVRSGDREWWGNCAWCSLGIVELAGGTASIVTALGAVGRQVTVRIEDGNLRDKDYVIHFPIKMTNVWDNVLYACSLMLLFETEADVDRWCDKHDKAKGDVRPIEQIWGFAREWYGRHLDADWQKWTADEAAAVFRRHGLDGPTWEIPVSDGRF